MASRPAKRRRKSTAVLSDDEDVYGNSQTAATKSRRRNPRSNSNLANGTAIAQISPTSRQKPTASTVARVSPQSSPEKSRKLKAQPDTNPNKSLLSFFGRATQEQRWHRRSSTPELDIEEGLVDDIVDDDDLEEIFSVASQQSNTSQPVITPIPSTAKRAVVQLPLSQRFARPAVPSRLGAVDIGQQDSDSAFERPTWADRYGPTSIDELAVHKRKIDDLRQWLDNVFAGREPKRLLVLKGPAGSGKTTTLALIAHAISAKLTFWRNPEAVEATNSSTMSQFADFLGRSGHYTQLQFDQVENPMSAPGNNHQILVVEEFPSILARTSNSLELFRAALLQLLAQRVQDPRLEARDTLTDNSPPVVLVISETLLTSATALSDSFTAHRLLGPELSNHPGVATIEFNPVAPTFVYKALDLVVKKEARDSRRRRMPGPGVMTKIAETGDIRSAINSLEFLCARGDENGDWSGTVASQIKKSTKNAVPLTEMEKNALQLISQRESTLDMFHASGKIVYNKRQDPRVSDTRAQPPPKPPDHLLHLHRPKTSLVDVDALLNETGTDIQTFISSLHENYVLSCNGDDLVHTFDSCADILSISDILNPDSRAGLRSRRRRNAYLNFQSGTVDMLRQDEISFQTTSLGLLFNLPHPVNRATPPNSSKQNAFKMFYPASLRLWKPTEEIQDLIDLNLQQSYGPRSRQKGSAPTGVASWSGRALSFNAASPLSTSQNESNAPRTQSTVSQEDGVTHLLPFMAKIFAAQQRDITMLKAITQFRGVYFSGEEPSDDELAESLDMRGPLVNRSQVSLSHKIDAAHSSLLLQQRSDLSSRDAKMPPTAAWLSHQHQQQQPNGREHSEKNVEIEKLYISDDDIIDD